MCKAAVRFVLYWPQPFSWPHQLQRTPLKEPPVITRSRSPKLGRDQMLFAGFGSDRPDRFVWPDLECEYATLRWQNGHLEQPTGIDLGARDRWFSQAVGMSFQNDKGPHHVGKT